MKIGGEEVELVTNFDQLRAGMVVWIQPRTVPWCNGKHRHILTKLSTDTHYVGQGARGVPSNAPAWDVLPARSCRPQAEPVVSGDTINRRTVYRVVDPLLDAQTTECKRERSNA